MIVTFGDTDLAKRWITTTNCKYPIVSDADRTLYKTFHLRSSVKHTWDIRAQVWYAEQLCFGRKLHPMAHGDDPHQLGGDVVVDKDGVLTLIHRSKYPLDRPSVDTIVENVKIGNVMFC